MTVTIEKLIVVKAFHPFTNTVETNIVCCPEFGKRIEDKKALSEVFEDLELTKEYWRVYEYLTGKKRKAVSVI